MSFYKASDIIKRSLQLADISNTDFLTHKEQTQYINDAWKTVYQWVINKGDKQFVREVELMNCQGFSDWVEYDIPNDLYQICSIRNKFSGSIVPRRAESEGITSNTYEVVNDKIRLYGVSSQSLLLTYWTVPTYITFPDKDIVTDLNYAYEPSGYFISRCKNTVLTSDGIIYNLLTGETYGNITIENGYKYTLGPGYVIKYASGSIIYLNFNDEEITTSLGDVRAAGLVGFYDENGTLYTSLYYNLNDTITINENFVSGPGMVGLSLDWLSISDGASYVPLAKHKDYILAGSTDGRNLAVYLEDGTVVARLPIAHTFTVPFESSYNNVVSNESGFFIAYNGVGYHIYISETGEVDVSTDKCPVNFVVEYGPVTSNYKTWIVNSSEEDTLLNFPNDIYYSLLSVDLALRYIMKQNADSTGLDNLYKNYQTTFMNTLTQDSGYTRITNVYQ